MQKLLLKFHNIHRKTTVLDSLFNKIAGLQVCDLIENRLQQRGLYY